MPLRAWCLALHFGQRSNDGTHQPWNASPRLLLRPLNVGTVRMPRCQRMWLPLDLSSQDDRVKDAAAADNIPHYSESTGHFASSRQTGSYRAVEWIPQLGSSAQVMRSDTSDTIFSGTERNRRNYRNCSLRSNPLVTSLSTGYYRRSVEITAR
jgi:hypothetical protein